MRITRRLTTVIVSAAVAAAGLAFTGASPALAATTPSTFILSSQASHAGCDITLFSARVSASTPAQVFASVDSKDPGHACTAFVERSATGKTAWSVASAKLALPSVSGLGGVANTGLVGDGPGFKARACVTAAGTTTVTCTSAVSLAKGAGSASSPALAPSWERKEAEVLRLPSTPSGDPGVCAALLASSTTAKKADTTVVALIVAVTDPCTTWVQSSANGGKTWTTVSPIVPVKGVSAPSGAAAFTAHYADGPGRLARICVKDLTSKKQSCSAGW